MAIRLLICPLSSFPACPIFSNYSHHTIWQNSWIYYACLIHILHTLTHIFPTLLPAIWTYFFTESTCLRSCSIYFVKLGLSLWGYCVAMHGRTNSSKPSQYSVVYMGHILPLMSSAHGVSGPVWVLTIMRLQWSWYIKCRSCTSVCCCGTNAVSLLALPTGS